MVAVNRVFTAAYRECSQVPVRLVVLPLAVDNRMPRIVGLGSIGAILASQAHGAAEGRLQQETTQANMASLGLRTKETVSVRVTLRTSQSSRCRLRVPRQPCMAALAPATEW